MPKVIDTIRFLEWGKHSPSGSRFKGTLTTESLFGISGFFEYTERDDATENNIQGDLFNRPDGFLGYTERDKATSGLTMSSLGFLDDKTKEKFLEEGRASFCEKGDIAWDLVISLENYETAFRHKLYGQAEYASAICKILPKFFKEIGLEPSNMVWWEAYHNNKSNPHMHVTFLEKVNTRSRGKITRKQLDKLKSLIVQETIGRTEIYEKCGINLKQYLKEKDIDKLELIKHAKNMDLKNIETISDFLMNLPPSGRLQYNSVHMVPFKEKLNELINNLLNTEDLRELFNNYTDKLNLLEQVINEGGASNVSTIYQTEIDKLYAQLGNMILDLKKQGSLEVEENMNDNLSYEVHSFDGSIENQIDIEIDSVGVKSNFTSKSNYFTDTYKKGMEFLYGSKDNFNEAFSLFSKEAEELNPLAMYQIAKMIEANLIENTTAMTAKEWYAKSLNLLEGIKDKSPYINYRIGKFYDFGTGVEQNYDTARSYYEKSIDYKYAQFSLGSINEYGKGCNVDFEKAYDHYLAAANDDAGMAMAEYKLGSLIETKKVKYNLGGRTITNCYEKALRLLQLEETPNENMLNLMATILAKPGELQDIKASFDTYIRSLTLGNKKAAFSAARLLDKNQIEINTEDLTSLFKDNPDLSSQAEIQDKLYEIYYQDILKAYNIKQDVSQACQIANMILYHQGNEEPVENALKYVDEAIEANIPDSKYLKSRILFKLERYTEMVPLLNDSLIEGNSNAYYSLGMLYLTGKIGKNKDVALGLLSEAALMGNEKAAGVLKQNHDWNEKEYEKKMNKLNTTQNSNSLLHKMGGFLIKREQELKDEIDQYLYNGRDK